MKRKLSIVALALAVLMVLSMAGCGSSATTASSAAPAASGDAASAASEGSAAGSGGKLVVYSPLSEEELKIAVPAFEEQTGIDVEVISGGTGELVARIQTEKDNPQGDVLFGGSMGLDVPAQDLWEDYVSPEDANYLDAYKNTTGKISTFCVVPTLIIENTNLIGDIKIESWNDLLNPALKGKIAYAAPAASSLSNVLMYNMLSVMGDGKDINTGWDWFSKLCGQLDGKVLSGSSAVPKGVADGEYTIGLTHELYYATYKADNAPIKAIYPKEGSVAIAGPITIIKNAPNMENAKKFVDYILGKDFQERYRDGHSARSGRKDVDAPADVPALDTLKIMPEVIVDTDTQNATMSRFKDELNK